MNNSPSIKAIAAALLEFQGKCGKIIKKADNPFFKSKYADLPSILDEIHAPLQACGLVISQFPDGDGLTTILMHPASGEWISATGVMHPVKSDPQAIGSAITYQRRYSICAVLGLNVDEDDDGNAASQPTKQDTNLNGKPWLNEDTQEFSKVSAWMKSQTDKDAAIKTLRERYAISKKMEALLKL